ncbi:MAG: 50S ribosomal protein L4 [Candidatus Aenigmarchaeota archaeon]|nr:50S ribosomal protein L4 [Candidatus Aenigmarchaeota archaeon]NIP41027.1 50S ribosomal protein L4 [Candidatus Aenigmarchaeota archaeon]NIQ17429.1 50S ribosomal protein L4 [Candidatus Aenigmarchaeota archaeon]NIS73623.1 50S ribosomal protein L4 [Candidatus Aenigmarchaeota archaeon]
MQAIVYGLNGKEKGKLNLPSLFSERVREDLIKRAILAGWSERRQAYGSDPLAGQRSSAHYHGRRGRRDSQMNRELARMKRIHGQGFLNLTARIVPQSIKGRRAHPPKPEKVWKLKINKKERRKALESAMAATKDREMVSKRGHKVNEVKNLPIVMEDDLQKLKKTKEVLEVLERMGLKEEIERCGERKVRSGKGKMRGRKYRNKKGPLIIVEKDEGIVKAGENIPGVDVVERRKLDVDLLAPGTHPGRLTILTKSVIKELGS